MSKRIVICCDGTWDKPKSKASMEPATPTNVLKVVRAIAPLDVVSDTSQVVYYNQGIGTRGKLSERIFTGSIGSGISENIQDCYRFLANNYADGDEIFCFGFSRGAFTIRSLCGFINDIGLLHKNDLEYVADAYNCYKIDPLHRATSRYNTFRNLILNQPRKVAIKFVGIWDTVAALGPPTPIAGWISQQADKIRRWQKKPTKYGFHNTALGDNIRNAYHALAIDEKRGPFKPSIWQFKGSKSNVTQTWFPGTHSDSGGGEDNGGLCTQTCRWMIDRAQQYGLCFQESYIKEFLSDTVIDPVTQTFPPIHNSFTWPFKLMSFLIRPHVRKIGEISTINEKVHESVLNRIKHDDNYPRENNLPSYEYLDSVSTYENGCYRSITINDKKIPVFLDREHQRQPPINVNAVIHIAGKQEIPCKVIDFNPLGGAKIELDEDQAIEIDGTIQLEQIQGQAFRVAWHAQSTYGLQFVA